uniref:Cytochrome c oxidase subunit 2 n=1 Tax=Terebratalia transversa TaxID=34513 RepID=Q953W9_TERTR|nr:cytochrome c oxidase subunit II [Terebratalia transversa]AAK95507.1 cytochrome oxidase subunit 2 [Terebratalia transversa]
MAYWFQDGSSPAMEQTIFFHDYVMIFLVVVLSLVLYLSFWAVYLSYTSRSLMVNHQLEVAWTLIPGGILFFLAVPSLNLLYSSDNLLDPSVTLKVVGHQWFWSYSYSDLPKGPLSYDSYMVPSSDLSSGEFRLLEVDNRIVLPSSSNIRALVTGADVIHSWSVPSLGVKIDAIPGRLNSVEFFSKMVGVYYGQCSEICGANHSFMPICVEFILPQFFMEWVSF